jgi:hypothetical protein
MIRLTDSQLDAIFRAARPLRVADRDAFLQDVAAALQGRSKIGDGDIHRAIVTAQKRHWDPPQLDHDVSQGSTLTRQAPPALVFAPHLGRPRAF